MRRLIASYVRLAFFAVLHTSIGLGAAKLRNARDFRRLPTVVETLKVVVSGYADLLNLRGMTRV